MILERFYMSKKYTQGILHVGDIVVYTLERPWLDNRRNISCIPEGRYHIYTFVHSKMGMVIGLEDVPERSEILIHPGNTIKDTAGCILPGTGCSYGKVLYSKKALEMILANRVKDYIDIINLV
jgi:hypothetical protein